MTEEELEEKSKEYALNKWEGQCPWGAIQQGYKDGYLAGLHEGQPKWHKVADGDLPPKKKPVLCYLFNESYMLAFLREDNVWTTNNHNAFENVHAWCEIPQFKE